MLQHCLFRPTTNGLCFKIASRDLLLLRTSPFRRFFVTCVASGISQMGDGDVRRHPSRRDVDHRRRNPELHQGPVEDRPDGIRRVYWR